MQPKEPLTHSTQAGRFPSFKSRLSTAPNWQAPSESPLDPPCVRSLAHCQSAGSVELHRRDLIPRPERRGVELKIGSSVLPAGNCPGHETDIYTMGVSHSLLSSLGVDASSLLFISDTVDQ